MVEWFLPILLMTVVPSLLLLPGVIISIKKGDYKITRRDLKHTYKKSNKMGLFEPGWQSSNVKKALRAVEKIKDEKLLYEIVAGMTSQIHFEVLELAASRITDQNILGNIASREYCEIAVFQLCLSKITDQNILFDILMNLKSHGFDFSKERDLIFSKITDQDIFINIANKHSDVLTRIVGIKKINNKQLKERLLLDIANKDLSGFGFYAYRAIENITDDVKQYQLLVKLLMTAKNLVLRSNIIKKIISMGIQKTKDYQSELAEAALVPDEFGGGTGPAGFWGNHYDYDAHAVTIPPSIEIIQKLLTDREELQKVYNKTIFERNKTAVKERLDELK